MLSQLLKPPPPQVQHELICSHNCRGGEDEEGKQDENWDCVCCKGQGSIFGEYHKVGRKQEDEEIGGGVYPGCSG